VQFAASWADGSACRIGPTYAGWIADHRLDVRNGEEGGGFHGPGVIDMKRAIVSMLILLTMVGTSASASENQAPSPELQKLGVSVGRWIFHGQTPKASSG
jgi:hypothetical protein